MATSTYAPTLERWLADLANTGRSTRTLEAYRRDVDDTMLTVAAMKGIDTAEPLHAFEQLDVATVTNDDLIAAIADYRTRPDPRFTTNPQRAPEERAPATVARRTAAVRTFFAWCYEHDIIAADPAAKLRTPPKRKRLPKALPPTVAAAALDTAQEGAGSRWPERDALIVALALACGLRLEEIATLTVDAVAGDGHDQRHQWLVVRGKGDKERRLGVPPVVADAIAAYLPTRERRLQQLGLDARTLVISSRPRPVRGRPTVEASRESVAYVVDRLLRRLGARRDHVRVHALRHTFATLGLQAGTFNLRQLQAALGHASLATTQVYTEVADDDLADAMARHPLAVSRPSQPG